MFHSIYIEHNITLYQAEVCPVTTTIRNKVRIAIFYTTMVQPCPKNDRTELDKKLIGMEVLERR